MWTWAGSSFLLGGRFDILGLGELVHAVFQIGGDDGLLLGACTEV